jgi:flagellar M-ring protein FliF
VTAEIDYDRVITNQETFDPDQQVVRSVQTVTEQSSSADGASQAVSVQTNLPEARAQGSPGGGSNSSTSRTEETTNYEISRTTRTQTREAGIVRRLSVAVLVDGNYTQGQDGTRSYQPRSNEELQSLATLVRSAVGFDAKRGDTVEIVNLQFPGNETVEPLAEEFSLLGLGKADLMRIAETGILGIVALLVLLLVVRPVLNRFMTPTGPQMPAGAPQLPPGQAQGQLALPAGAAAAPGTELAPAAPVSEVEKMIDIARIEGQVKASSVKRIGEIVQRHPEEAVSIVRTWMYQDS